MALGVLLGHPEVDVEQQEGAVRRRLGPSTVEHLAEPGDVDELVVVGQALERQRLVGGPGRSPSLEDPGSVDAERSEPADERRGVHVAVAVDGDLATRGHALRVEEALDLGLVDGVDPGDGERDGAGHVAASRDAAPVPAVVGDQRSDVDDRQVRVVESLMELGGGDRGHR